MKRDATAPSFFFLRTLKAANPHRVTELEYTSVFELPRCVARAQATDVSGTRPRADRSGGQHTAENPDLGLEWLEGYIQTIGLFQPARPALQLQACHMPGPVAACHALRKRWRWPWGENWPTWKAELGLW
jgi:endonuclease-3